MFCDLLLLHSNDCLCLHVVVFALCVCLCTFTWVSSLCVFMSPYIYMAVLLLCVCLCTFTWPSSLCISISVSSLDCLTSSWVIGVTLTQYDLILKELITSVKTLFPSKVTFWLSWWLCVWEKCNSTQCSIYSLRWVRISVKTFTKGRELRNTSECQPCFPVYVRCFILHNTCIIVFCVHHTHMYIHTHTLMKFKFWESMYHHTDSSVSLAFIEFYL